MSKSRYGFDFDNDMFFLVMEYCRGGSVFEMIRQKGGRLSIQEALSIALQVLEGLEYTHNVEISLKTADGSIAQGKGLVHRDIKPENIFVSITENDRVRVKLGDYGLSKAFWLAGLSGFSKNNIPIGTPQFMSRQQVRNFKYSLPEVDVWATAATLYNMLTGQYPRNFPHGDYLNLILGSQPIPIRKRDTSIPEPLAEVIDRGLIDNPEIYFKSAKEFQQALLAAIDRL